MTFLNGWALALGVLALAGPLIVHFLTKPKPKTLSLSTIGFLQEVIQQRRARSRLRDLLVLLLRLATILLLASALARPVFDAPAAVAVQPEGQVARIVLLDVSQSMAMGAGGASAMARAQATALRYLEPASGMAANVIFVGAQAKSVFKECSPNVYALQEAVRKAKALPQRAQVRDAIEEAGRQLAAISSDASELIVVSDFQRANWGNLYLELVPPNTRIQFESVAVDEVDNVAIIDVRVARQAMVGRETLVEVEIQNASPRDVDLRCEVRIGNWQQTLTGRATALSNTVLTATTTFAEPGWIHGWTRLLSNVDQQPADDQRPVAMEVVTPPRVLLVSRQPAQQKPSAGFYLEQALRVLFETREESSDGDGELTAGSPVSGQPRSRTQSSVTRIQPQRSSAIGWPESDLYLLDHPGTLDEKSLEFLGARIRRGAGLLYLTGELVDAVNLQRLTQTLGASFEPPVELLAPANGMVRSDLFIRKVNARLAPFDVLGDAGPALLRAVRWGGGSATRQTQEGLRDQVIAELSDSSALGYLTPCDAGQIAVLNVDLEQSNWCVHPSFVPILSQLTETLAERRQTTSHVACGEPLIRLLPSGVPDDARLQIRPADDATPEPTDYGNWEWSSSQGGLVWAWPEPTGPGIYEVDHEGQCVGMVASAAPAIEVDLTTLDKKIITGRLAGSRAVGFRTTEDQDVSNDDLWSWLIVGCVMGLISEVLALGWFRN